MAPKTGRNDPCPCGSGNKFKRCCLPREEQAARETARQQTLFEEDGNALDDIELDDYQ